MVPTTVSAHTLTRSNAATRAEGCTCTCRARGRLRLGCCCCCTSHQRQSLCCCSCSSSCCASKCRITLNHTCSLSSTCLVDQRGTRTKRCACMSGDSGVLSLSLSHCSLPSLSPVSAWSLRPALIASERRGHTSWRPRSLSLSLTFTATATATSGDTRLMLSHAA